MICQQNAKNLNGLKVLSLFTNIRTIFLLVYSCFAIMVTINVEKRCILKILCFEENVINKREIKNYYNYNNYKITFNFKLLYVIHTLSYIRKTLDLIIIIVNSISLIFILLIHRKTVYYYYKILLYNHKCNISQVNEKFLILFLLHYILLMYIPINMQTSFILNNTKLDRSLNLPLIFPLIIYRIRCLPIK